MSEIATAIHAHRCEVCAAKGKQVLWAHTETCYGVKQAHKCPECGSVNWKKFLVEPGKLPQMTNAQGKINFDTILGYAMVIIGLAILGYGAFLYIKKWREAKSVAVSQ